MTKVTPNGNASQHSFQIKYDGVALKDGRMQVRDLAPALMSLVSLLEKGNGVSGTEQSNVEVLIKSDFEKGCFIVTFDLIVASAIQMFNNVSLQDAKNVIEMIFGKAGLFDIVKKAKGKPVEVVSQTKESVTLKVEGMDSFEATVKVVKLYENKEVRQAASALLKPLESDGMDYFEVKSEGKKLTQVKTKELGYFAPLPEPDVKESAITSEYEAFLVVISQSFDDGKWRFQDGDAKYFAEITDADWAFKIAHREIAILKGDALRAIVRRTQTLNPKTQDQTTTYQIVKVLERIEPPKQRSLLSPQ